METHTNASNQQPAVVPDNQHTPSQSVAGTQQQSAGGSAKTMIGPLEYIVMSVDDDQFVHTVLPELQAIHDGGHIRVVDLLFAQKNADGTLTVAEVPDLDPQVAQHYGAMADSLTGLLTPEDIGQLASMAPPDTGVAIALFEHTWTLGLTYSVHNVGGQFFGGGMVAPDVLQQVIAELTVKEDDHA